MILFNLPRYCRDVKSPPLLFEKPDRGSRFAPVWTIVRSSFGCGHINSFLNSVDRGVQRRASARYPLCDIQLLTSHRSLSTTDSQVSLLSCTARMVFHSSGHIAAVESRYIFNDQTPRFISPSDPSIYLASLVSLAGILVT